MDEGFYLLCQLRISFSLNRNTNGKLQESKADPFWGCVRLLVLVALLIVFDVVLRQFLRAYMFESMQFCHS